MTTLNKELVLQHLSKVIDPELNVDIVSLGLIYDVTFPTEGLVKIHILMTLTTPGCPLAGVFDKMVRDSLVGLEGLDVQNEVFIELTFDPPWVPDLMSEEAKAELGFD
jgi:metal-sulfur cluster biosynthetic enzyme